MVLAPSAGGKSTLMRYLREHTDLHIAETDEEVVKANNNEWPSDDEYKDSVLIPQTTSEIISRAEVVYFMKDVPVDLLKKARQNGFKVVVLKLTINQLKDRNTKRMKEEGYDDASQWLQGQLDELDRLNHQGLVDVIIDGNLPTPRIADEILGLIK